MNNWIDAHAVLIRLVSVVTAFVAMAIAEVLLEARPQRVARRTRWLHNLGLTLLNTVVLRILFPVGAVSAALWSANDGFGVLNLVEWPTFAEIVVALAILDLAIYGQHVLFHAVPLLFRFHRVHHADVDFDVTLGARFHPIELLLSMSIKLAVVAALGASVTAVILFETVLAVTSLFNHANVRLPNGFERMLRWVVVTPAMHAVHHSTDLGDRDTNFGFSIPWWDHLFGTYRPRSSSERVTFGVAELQFQTRQTLAWMLALPFRLRGSRREADREPYQQAA